MSPKTKRSLAEERERDMQWLLSQDAKGSGAERQSELRIVPPAPAASAPPGFTEEWAKVATALRAAPIVDLWMEVTPEMARDWLLHRNTNNRPIRRGRVAAIAGSIAMGRYTQTHQGVAFSKSGVLMDGQHRLAAIVLAQAPLLLRVSFGLPDDAINNIDSDMATRLPGDVLTLQGEEHGKDKAAVIRSLVILETRDSTSISNTMRQSTLNRFRDAIEWAIDYCSRRQLRAPVCAALAYAWTIEPEKTDALAKAVSTGIGIAEDSPAHALKICLEGASARSDGDTIVLMLKALRCAEMQAKGESIKKLYHTEAGFKFFRAAREKKGLD